MFHQAHDNEVPLKKIFIHLLINHVWMKGWEDDSISRKTPVPFLKGSTISMLPYYRACNISWAKQKRNEQLIFYDPEKKNQARKKDKAKDPKNPWYLKNEPKWTLIKEKSKEKKGKRIQIRTFEGDFPLLVCGFARTRLPWTMRKKAPEKFNIEES